MIIEFVEPSNAGKVSYSIFKHPHFSVRDNEKKTIVNNITGFLLIHTLADKITINYTFILL